MLARATEGTDAPTPGYLYLDISKNASSSPVATQEIAQYLTRRMSGRTNPNIKYKCLKVIAKTASTCVLFQRAIVQDAAAVSMIKECLQFRGPPDPARGDEPYQKVRTAAKEALDAIYSEVQAPAGGGGMQGIGGGVYGGGVPPGNYGGGGAPASSSHGGPGRMEGIGNPMFQDPRQQQEQQRNGPPATMDVIREVGRTFKNMIEDPLATRVQTGPPQGGGSNMPGIGGGGYSNPPGRSQLQNTTGGQWNMASNRGPNAVTGNDAYYKQNQPYNWASKNNNSNSSAAGGVGGSWGAGGVSSAARQPAVSVGAPAPYTQANSTTGFGSGGTASSDGQHEKNLIMELCPPGGLKAEPPIEKLLQFQQAIPSLNPDLICPVLLDCLEEGQPWIMRGKALQVMKVCIEVGVGEDGVNKYADFFHECRAEIEPLSNHNRAAIRDPAKKILQLLGVDGTGASDASATATARSATAAPPAPIAADLLDFGSDEPAVSAPPVAAPPAAPSSGSMFGGLTVQGSASSETPAPAPAGPPPVVQSSSSGSMFGGLTVQGGAAAPAAPIAEESLLDAMPAAVAGGASGFGFMQETTPTPAAPAPAGSGFSFMQETPAAAPAPAAAAESGSAFDFMQQEQPQQQAPPPPPPPTPSTPSRQQPATFDPLAQGYQPSPNSASKQASAAMLQQQQQQMAAAAAYQQQMLMMQMQQMQLAMAMQQKGNIAKQNQQKPMMSPAGAGMNTTSSFSFLDVGAQPPSMASAEKDQKFDFVKDALKDHQKK